MKIEEKKLPNGWEVKKLGEVCIYSKGKMPKVLTEEKNEKCSVPYINIKAFEKGIFSEYTNGEKCNLCDDDDLLMVWDGARCGLIGKAKKGAVGSTLMKILPKEIIHKEFLYYFISSKFRTLNTKPRGVGIPHIEPSLLWNFELFLPPLPEQQKIVAKIEELFSELENGKKELLIAQAKLKTYRQSLLKWAFEGRLTNKNLKDGELPKGWEVKKLGEVCDIIMGQSPPSSSYNYNKIGLPFFQGKAEFTELYPVVEKWCDSPNKIALPNDILLSVRAPVGTTNIANQKCCIGRGLAAIRYDNYKYVFYFLRRIEQELDKKGTGTTFRAISGETIKSTEIPIPPLPEQQQIVAILESKLTICDAIEETIKTSINKCEALRQSILQKAFSGELINKNSINCA